MKADVLALAVIADGEISPAERAAIGEFATARGIDPDDAMAKVASLTEQVRDPAVLRERESPVAQPRSTRANASRSSWP